MENFSDVAKSAWTTDDGKTTFCVPMASVIHGFIYNKKIFDELKLDPAEDRRGVPSPSSTRSRPTATTSRSTSAPPTSGKSATMGFQNIGPNYWQGEDGRKALIAGNAKFTDKPYVDTWAELASWAPYMGDGYQAQKYPDSQNLFTPRQGGDLSGRLVGHHHLREAVATSSSAPSRRRSRRPATPATSATTPTSPSA